MDAIELLTNDHRAVEQLFHDYRAAESDERHQCAVAVTMRELSKHVAMEEQLIYPIAKQVLPDGVQAVDQRLAGHKRIKRLLVALDKHMTNKERTDALMADLQQEFDRHVRADEDDLLPRLHNAVGPHALDELGNSLDSGKQVATTRAHPKIPDQPPALGLIGPLAAIYDRLRDWLQHRPRT